MCFRKLAAVAVVGVVCLLSAHAAHAQDQPQPGQPGVQKPVPRPKQWWCEVFAQPASYGV